MALVPAGVGPLVNAGGLSAGIGQGLRFAWDNRDSILSGYNRFRNWLNREPYGDRARMPKRGYTGGHGGPSAKRRRLAYNRNLYMRKLRSYYRKKRYRKRNTLKRKFYRRRSKRRVWGNRFWKKNSLGIRVMNTSTLVIRHRYVVNYQLGFGNEEPEIKKISMFSTQDSPMDKNHIPYDTRSKFEDYYFTKLKSMRVNYSNFRRHDVLQMFGDKTAPGSGAGTTTTQQLKDHEDLVCHYYFDSKGVFEGSSIQDDKNYLNNNFYRLRRVKKIKTKQIYPSLSYVHRPNYTSIPWNGWVKYSNKGRYGDIQAFLNILNTGEPIKFMAQKLGSNDSKTVVTDNINAEFNNYNEPALYMSIDEGYCKNLFSDGSDLSSKTGVVGLEAVKICVEFDKEIVIKFVHKQPRGDEVAEKPDYNV